MEFLSEDLVLAFSSMVIRSDFEVAFELVSGISDKIPPPSLINDVIFKILMANCEDNIANEANAYLCNYLMLLPQKSEEFRYDYRAVLEDKSGRFKDIWSVFSCLVKSCFSYHNIQNKKICLFELVKYPNCDILAEFYARMLNKFLSLDHTLFEDDPDDRFSMLLLWINKVYKLTDQKVPILDSLHTLLNNKVNSEISYDSSLVKIEVITNLILEECPDVFNSVENMTIFFAKSNLPSLHLSICEHKLYELIHCKKLSKKKHSPLTLKTIVFNYFLIIYKDDYKEKTDHSQIKMKSSKSKSKDWKKLFLNKKVNGDTKLHEFCHENHMGDLYEVLKNESNLNLNSKNSLGYTPLHVACLAKSYHCVKFLLETPVEGDKIDLQATDKNGMTPLHCAAYANNLDIAKILLKHGGKQLAKLEDNFGMKAINYTNFKKLQKVLRESEDSIAEFMSNKSLIDLNMKHLSIPTIKNNEEYPMFLYALHTLLSQYLATAKLYKYKKEGLEKLSHKDLKCPHYEPTDNGVCDEDVSIMENLPHALDYFCACVQKNAESIDVKIPTNLLSFIMLRKMLDCFV